jgi:5,10-methylene-tetrahydrofolate dehydrogenase/methenyl tetrahydrofolate cyclohydrolase
MSTARLLPGAPVAEAVLHDVADRAARLRARGVTPSLATILVGDDDASAGYIRIKQRQAADLGFASPHVHLPADTTQQELLRAVDGLNADRDVHGLLIQYPIPAHLDYDAALQRVDPDMDVDGMHPRSRRALAASARRRWRCCSAMPCWPPSDRSRRRSHQHGPPNAGDSRSAHDRGHRWSNVSRESCTAGWAYPPQ